MIIQFQGGSDIGFQQGLSIHIPCLDTDSTSGTRKSAGHI